MMSQGSMAALFIAPLLALSSAGAAAEAPLASTWTKAENSRVRLVGGRIEGQAAGHLVAGIEIEMAEGWKTYWRNPGSSGVPPRVDWSKSGNLADARLMFPAPQRFVDPYGDTIGYKDAVLLPIEIKAKDAAKPVELVLSAEYGICKDICIPVELSLTLSVPPDAAVVGAGSRLAQALERVPRRASQRAATDPSITSMKAELSGDKPRIVIHAAFPAGTKAPICSWRHRMDYGCRCRGRPARTRAMLSGSRSI